MRENHTQRDLGRNGTDGIEEEVLALLGKDNDAAESRAMAALELAERTENDRLREKCHALLSKICIQREDPQSAIRHLERARNLAERFDTITALRRMMEIATIYYRGNRHGERMEILREVAGRLEEGSFVESNKLTSLRINLHNRLASAHSTRGDFILALEHSYAALNMCELETATPSNLMDTLHATATLFYLFHDSKASIRYAEQLYELALRHHTPTMQMHALFSLCRAEDSLQHYSRALSYQRQLRQIAEEENNRVEIGMAHMLATQIHVPIGAYDRARYYAAQAIEILDRTVPYQANFVRYLLAVIDMREGRAEQAIEAFERFLSFADEHGFEGKLLVLHQNLSEAYQAVGNDEKALKHLRAFHDLRESMLGAEKQREVVMMELKQRTSELERQIEQSERLLGTLRRSVLQRDSTLRTSARQLLSEARTESVAASENRSSGSGTDETMEGFASRFDDIHRNFRSLLVRQHPTVTPAEINVCYLIRSGLRSKEIADVLNVAPSTVDVYRHRIRKKIDLLPQFNLHEFLSAL